MDINQATAQDGVSGAAAGKIVTKGVKPRLRGIPDVIGTILAVPAAALIIAYARPGMATLAAAIYSSSLVFVLAVSATYHTPYWPLNIRAILRRLDHSAIFVMIAGSYTPVCLVVLRPELGNTLLLVAWSVAALGFAKSILWPSAPRALNAGIYVGFGWMIVPFLGELYTGIGLQAIMLMGAGGLVYTVGAVIYARRWPNPSPAVFGYHEVFHCFVIAAATFHYILNWGLVT